MRLFLCLKVSFIDFLVFNLVQSRIVLVKIALMKFLFVIIFSFPIMLFGQNEGKVNKIKHYLSTGVNIGNKDKIGYQVGFSFEKNNHTVQSQFMRSKEWVLSFYGNYQEPDRVENLCTYSIKYGYVFKSKLI